VSLPAAFVRWIRDPIFLIIIVAVTSSHQARADSPDTPFLLEFLAGEYRLIGQQPDSGAPYVGKVSLCERNGQFELVRTVGGTTIHGTGSITTAGEGTAVLKSQFTVAGVAYEAMYLWRSDMDNYPRLTGYVIVNRVRQIHPDWKRSFTSHPRPRNKSFVRAA
jgi:hypothetical protein